MIRKKHEHFQKLISPTIDGDSSASRDQSSHLIVMAPSDISMNDYSEQNQKRVFESTLAANTGRYNVASPSLSHYRSENFALSQPKVYQQKDLSLSVQHFNLKSPGDHQIIQPHFALAASAHDNKPSAPFQLTSSFAT